MSYHALLDVALDSPQNSSLYWLPQVQEAAIGLVEGLSGSLEGIENLLRESDKLLPALLKLIGADKDLSKGALTSLINISQVQSSTSVEVLAKIFDRLDFFDRGISSHSDMSGCGNRKRRRWRSW